MGKLTYLLLISVLAIGLLCPFPAFSQAHVLPPDQPEQDACHALPLCGGKFTTPYSYQGTGLVLDLNETPCDQGLGGGETNSMWMTITIANAGKLAFRIIPADTVDDYDFAVLNVSHTLCSNLSSSDVVRCNFNNNEPGSNPGGIVGLDDTATMQSVQGGVYGWSFAQSIDATPGQIYLIMINNFGNDADLGGSPSAGFTIDFSGSTATFQTNTPPKFDSVVRQCSDSSLIIQLTKPVLCSSIAPDGSQFSISPAVPIASAAGVNCVNDSGYTSRVVLNFAGHYPGGQYTVTGQASSSGVVITDLCGDSISGSSGQPPSLSFVIPKQIQDDFLGPDTTKCNYATITLSALQDFANYLWSTGQTTSSIAVIDSGTYTLRVVDANGCVGSETQTVKDSSCPQYSYFPSAFSPNNDGKNDVFRPVYAGPVNSFHLAIYDRWGRLVFSTDNPTAGWDGTSGGVPQPEGVYVWMCVYQLYEKPQSFQKGTVMLVR